MNKVGAIIDAFHEVLIYGGAQMTVRYHEGKSPPDNLDWGRIAPHLARASSEVGRDTTASWE